MDRCGSEDTFVDHGLGVELQEGSQPQWNIRNSLPDANQCRRRPSNSRGDSSSSRYNGLGEDISLLVGSMSVEEVAAALVREKRLTQRLLRSLRRMKRKKNGLEVANASLVESNLHLSKCNFFLRDSVARLGTKQDRMRYDVKNLTFQLSEIRMMLCARGDKHTYEVKYPS
ncbi:hypothetical protein ERJ75_001450300 [Trypanosoma vivax]|uniref:Uncharacterized protein n=1 Tax=Trypanosoma vivax (strain Y486) TaxID=1055687 RepID=G0TW68_TRYVY|nr:hypothetical protein TRVL_07256 [Trypanosoma vivax]KAH8607035.1 hypothetical protein ERJ75_001450300 [Trypanosoma vivax]CCC48184.1 conserved hypothetical protein [Trypanosoma vivax Y486]